MLTDYFSTIIKYLKWINERIVRVLGDMKENMLLDCN